MKPKDVMRQTVIVKPSNIQLPSIKLRFNIFLMISLTIFLKKALFDQSVTCKQNVKHVCFTNALTNLSSWTGRNGENNSYWSGDKDPSEKVSEI